jgi:hypothetical protein
MFAGGVHKTLLVVFCLLAGSVARAGTYNCRGVMSVTGTQFHMNVSPSQIIINDGKDISVYNFELRPKKNGFFHKLFVDDKPWHQFHKYSKHSNVRGEVKEIFVRNDLVTGKSEPDVYFAEVVMLNPDYFDGASGPAFGHFRCQ